MNYQQRNVSESPAPRRPLGSPQHMNMMDFIVEVFGPSVGKNKEDFTSAKFIEFQRLFKTFSEKVGFNVGNNNNNKNALSCEQKFGKGEEIIQFASLDDSIFETFVVPLREEKSLLQKNTTDHDDADLQNEEFLIRTFPTFFANRHQLESPDFVLHWLSEYCCNDGQVDSSSSSLCFPSVRLFFNLIADISQDIRGRQQSVEDENNICASFAPARSKRKSSNDGTSPDNNSSLRRRDGTIIRGQQEPASVAAKTAHWESSCGDDVATPKNKANRLTQQRSCNNNNNNNNKDGKNFAFASPQLSPLVMPFACRDSNTPCNWNLKESGFRRQREE